MLEQFVSAVMRQLATPKADLEHNIRMLATDLVARLDLVTREEVEQHIQQLNIAREQVALLSQKVNDLVVQQQPLENTVQPASLES